MSSDSEPRRILGRLGALVVVVRAVLGRRRYPPSLPPAAPESGVDPRRRVVPNNRRAEAVVAILLLAAAVCGLGFTVIYVAAEGNTQLLGLALGFSFMLLAAACIVAGKMVVPQETSVEERDKLLDEQETEEVVEMVESGGEGISRRGLLTAAGCVAGAGVVTALATPVASLGPTLNGIHSTQWRRGMRLVDDQGNPYTPDDIEIGSFYTALPEHGEPEHLDAGLLVVKLPPRFLHLPGPRRAWAPQGVVAYSKICTHAGCAISLYRYPTYQPTSNGPAFTCPCHYSTFLPGEGGRVVFGPAGRALPQLPLMIDAQGYLAAASDFHEGLGPSWWNIHRGES
jgi:ubiquinol-cytochrome c reductase iron-sulfur subunit